MSVKIKLESPSGKYQIVTDSRQYKLQTFSGVDKKTGSDKYTTVGYFHGLDGLHKHIVALGIKSSSCEQIGELVDVVQHVSNSCDKAYKEFAHEYVLQVAKAHEDREKLADEVKGLKMQLRKLKEGK